jgi:hypothetical protein
MTASRQRAAAYPASVAAAWTRAMREKHFPAWLAASVLYVSAMVVFLNYFLPYINRRQGVVLADPLLKWLPAADLSPWIFGLIYLSVALTLLWLLDKPALLLRTLMTAALVYSLRVLTLYFVPLAPPAGCIPLSDPFILHFAYGGVSITRDLFFSGHTACMFILVLAAGRRPLRLVLLAAMAAVIVMLLIQHAHYSIDILGALAFTPLCWKLSGRRRKKQAPAAVRRKASARAV